MTLEVWQHIRQEAKELAECEPMLASFFHSTILKQKGRRYRLPSSQLMLGFLIFFRFGCCLLLVHVINEQRIEVYWRKV